jgi:hypothetical protein
MERLVTDDRYRYFSIHQHYTAAGKMGGRRNTYGGVVRTPTRTVVRTPTRTVVRTPTSMCSHNTYTSCVVTRPTLNYV